MTNTDLHRNFGTDPQEMYRRGLEEGFVRGLRAAHVLADFHRDSDRLLLALTEIALKPSGLQDLTPQQFRTSFAAAVAAAWTARNGVPKIELVKESA